MQMVESKLKMNIAENTNLNNSLDQNIIDPPIRKYSNKSFNDQTI